jgi:CubicO group peptidase (beta-lactamase class C family)
MQRFWSLINRRAAKFAEFVNAYAKLGRFSGAALVARGDQLLFERAYGMANHDHHVPNTPQTSFRLGSLTKSFTALAVMQLQEQGNLKVSDTVAAYLPGYPQGEQITLHHLLTNTSGILDYVATPDFARQMRLPMMVEELIALFKDYPLSRAPGASFSYSNSNWVLLGAIIERVSGLAYGDYLHRHIFDPAGMTRSGYEQAEQVLPGRAEGYVQTTGKIVRAAFVDPSTMYAAGGLYSTVGDLYRWQQALVSNTLVSRAGYAQLVAPHVPAEQGAYGYGWFSDTAFDRCRQGHDGGTPGFLSIAVRYPEADLSVIVLANSEESAIHEIERGLAAIALGQPYELPGGRNFVQVDPALFAAYTGHYETRFMGRRHVLLITQEADRLIVEAQGLPKTELLPLSPTRYFARLKGEVELDFLVNGDGRAHEIALKWTGYRLSAQRLGN